MKKTIPLLFASFPIILFSQSNLIPGFIVKANGDTVKGYLKQIPEKQVADKIYFSPVASSNPETLTTTDLTGFGYEGQSIYSKVTYIHPYAPTTNERFAKTLVTGYYKLYSFWEKDILYYVIKTNTDSTYLLYDDNFSPSGIVNEKGNYKNQLLYFSVACSNLKSSVENLEYSQQIISKYVDKLNQCISPSTSNTIVYKKDKSYLNIYAYAGGMVPGKGHEFTAKLIARITIPSLDKKMSVNFGINYIDYRRESFSNLRYRDQTLYSIPFTLQYNFIQGRITPYIDAGLTLDYIQKNEVSKSGLHYKDSGSGIGVTVAAGIEGYVTKRLMINAYWRYELFMHYPVIGIGYFIK